MKLHANAALSWTGRRRLCERVVVEGWTVAGAAASAGVSVRCARKWVGRYRAEGAAGLGDRSSAPRRVANRTAEDRVEAIVRLRRLRFTAAEIAETLQMPLSTVSAVLKRNGVGRLGRLGLEPAVRYERSRPGELVHIDVKKLGRFQAAGKRVGFRPAGQADRAAATRTATTAAPQAGTTSTSPSTTTAASPTPRSSPTRRPQPQSASATCAPNRADPRPTAKPSASSAPSSTAGPTPRSTAQAPTALPPLTAGSGTTTINADTQHSAANRPSAEPTCLGLTPSRAP